MVDTWECGLAVSYKTKATLPYNPAIVLLGIYQKEKVKKLCLHKSLHTDIYNSFIHNCQNLEAINMSLGVSG